MSAGSSQGLRSDKREGVGGGRERRKGKHRRSCQSAKDGSSEGAERKEQATGPGPLWSGRLLVDRCKELRS